ncbi:DUF1289 domain-containing protein [Endozoicomonas sp. SM1973]|uniref:DUF1289 domain-containing protein n=1 Tax=Spartinivicinus marinus TaxID=2994442 RepID=A0A853I9J0_9GAMM|nr:DUF1289 domain-containing protein [Spartinivicinus marinus]MCX4027344.1 DUF1289 domain-containing protein [Spartinivicinus marinus]NYZ68432.1 DUF1289 domain-containing protein [Spartinivicinus marinus]
MSSNKPSTTDSPCVRNCCLDNNDVCVGCFRSLAEILEWHTATEARRKQIVENANKRKKHQ